MNDGGKYTKCRGLRDLSWAIESPYLMNPLGSEEGDFSTVSKNEIGQLSEQKVETFVERYTGHRVGYYFENLIHFWLKYVRQVEILAQGKQIVEEGRTLGELDFVFRDEEGRVNHWEVAAKFYLYCEDQRVKGSHFIGPNAQDTFELKREKIFAKQLPLSERVFPGVDVRQAFVKGRIFYHPEDKAPDELPSGMRPDHLRGIWMRSSELSLLGRNLETEVTRYHLIKKPYWLAPERLSESDLLLLSFAELRGRLAAHFSECKQATLISVLRQDGRSWQEKQRVFVVADDWLEI